MATIALLGSRSRLRVWAGALVVCWVISAISVGWVGARDQPVDYLSFWAAGTLVLDGQAADVYDIATHHQATEAFTGEREQPLLPWQLPPHALLISTGLASLGYYPGLILWTLGTAALFAATAAHAGGGKLAVLIAFAVPPTAWNLQIGQFGFLIATAMYWSIADENRPPWQRGLALVVLSLKPQFGLLVLIYLLLRGRWSTIGLGAAFGLAVVALTSVAFGIDRWWEFIDRSLDAMPIVDLVSGPLVWKSQSVFGLMRGLGAGSAGAAALHVLVGVIIVGHAARLCRTQPVHPATTAFMLTGSIALSPRSFPYDLQVLALSGILIVAGARREGLEIPERTLLSAFAASWLMFVNLPGGLLATVLLLFSASRMARSPTSISSDSPILMIRRP